MKCNVCENRISKISLIERIHESDTILCRKCGTLYNADSLYLSSSKSIPDWIGIFLFIIGLITTKFYFIIGVVVVSVGAALFIYGRIRFLRNVKLTVISTLESEPISIFTGKGSQESNLESEVAAYKKHFKRLSNRKLNEIIEHSQWSKPAKIAAKELLNK